MPPPLHFSLHTPNAFSPILHPTGPTEHSHPGLLAPHPQSLRQLLIQRTVTLSTGTFSDREQPSLTNTNRQPLPSLTPPYPTKISQCVSQNSTHTHTTAATRLVRVTTGRGILNIHTHTHTYIYRAWLLSITNSMSKYHELHI